MTPEIKRISKKLLIGMFVEMSIVNNRTGELFRSFMPRKKELKNTVDNNTLDVRLFPLDYYRNFSSPLDFTKWAAVEVHNAKEVPEGMQALEIPEGLYAIFHYKGLSNDPSVFQYIFTQWLPSSGYELDNRPHFDVLSERTKLNDPNSEEEICIPIKPKKK